MKIESYISETLHKIFGEGNSLRNKLQEGTSKSRDSHPLLKPDNTRRKITEGKSIEVQ